MEMVGRIKSCIWKTSNRKFPFFKKLSIYFTIFNRKVSCAVTNEALFDPMLADTYKNLPPLP
jgi:hypothetical protein